jgi:5-methylcytosine-specific restriction endonuclease McrA
MAGNYFAKLKDPRWQKLRLKVLDRDDWACLCCGGKTETLHVHHGYYEGKYDPWDYDEETLHTVCESCHDHANDLRRDVQREVAQLSLQAQESLLWLLSALNSIHSDDAITVLSEATYPLVPSAEQMGVVTDGGGDNGR